MNVLLIGCGYWGKNVLRNLLKFPEVSNVYISDLNDKEISRLIEENPKRINQFSDFSYLDVNSFDLYGINCAIICTPPKNHFESAFELIDKHKIPCLIQKPFVQNLEHLKILKESSLKNSVTLMAAHTFIYHPAINHIETYLERLGNPYSYKSIRYNLGLFNRDGNVIEDLLPHDASILYYLFGSDVKYISATGSSSIKEGLIDTANITVSYNNGFYANIDLSWLSAIKIRQIIINGSDKTVVFDDNNVNEKLKYYDTGVNYDDKDLFSYRKGDVIIPKIVESESIYNEISHFFSCIKNNLPPLTGADDAEFSIKLVNKAIESIEKQGTPILF